MENTANPYPLYIVTHFVNPNKGKQASLENDYAFFFYLQIMALFNYKNGELTPILPGGFFFDVVNNEIVGAKQYDDSHKLPDRLRKARFISLECIFETEGSFFEALANVFLTGYPGKSLN